MDAARDILAGTAAGVAQTISGHPMDTVKVRLQTQSSENPVFRGTLDCVIKTWQQEGISGFYRGVMAPLAGSLVQNAAIFGVYGSAARFFGADKKAEGGSDLVRVAKASAVTGFCLAFVESPVELVKCRLQAQVGVSSLSGESSSSYAMAKKIVRRHGFSGLCHGLNATIVRSTTAKVLYFVSFEWAVQKMATDPSYPSLSICFLAGGFAGGVAWGVNYPSDIVKSRLQTDHIDAARRSYKGMLDCATQIWRKEGAASFLKGFVPCMVRAVLVNACIFVAFTAAKRAAGPSSRSSVGLDE